MHESGYDSDLLAILVLVAGLPVLAITGVTLVVAALRVVRGSGGASRSILTGMFLALLVVVPQAGILMYLLETTDLYHKVSQTSVSISVREAVSLALPPAAVLLGTAIWGAARAWSAWRSDAGTGPQPGGGYRLTREDKRRKREAEEYRRIQRRRESGDASVMDALLLFVGVPVAGIVAYFVFHLDAVIVVIMAAMATWGILAKPGPPR